MSKKTTIFNKELEYDFLSSWIRYLRLENDISQEALAHGICSTSHLSYFENGKRILRDDIIESLLIKLGIKDFNYPITFADIRQKLYSMIQEIEGLNKESAKDIYCDLLDMEDFINNSLYCLEFKVYKLVYLFFVEGFSYDELKIDIELLDKSLNYHDINLKYLYYLTTGKCIFTYKNHDEGISRLLKAKELKDTPWINYTLGFCHSFNNEPLMGTYFLSSSLQAYEQSGKYINAVLCHNYLGVSYCFLHLYQKAILSFNAALNGAKYFNMNKIIPMIYVNLSDNYHHINKFDKSMKYSKLAMELYENTNNEFALLAACNYITSAKAINRADLIQPIFTKYLCKEYKNSRYYYFLYFYKLYYDHFAEEIFYNEVTKEILPYYKKINYIELITEIKLKLIEYLEKNRRYKEANSLYKELLATK